MKIVEHVIHVKMKEQKNVKRKEQENAKTNDN